jgi:hypothetical protein
VPDARLYTAYVLFGIYSSFCMYSLNAGPVVRAHLAAHVRHVPCGWNPITFLIVRCIHSRFCWCSGTSTPKRVSSRREDLGKGGPKQKKKKTRDKKTIPKNNRPAFPFFFFLGAPCVGCGPSVDMPPHVATRSWLWGLPLRASSL